MEILSFLFSPFGQVGRAAWWLTQLAYIITLMILGVLLLRALHITLPPPGTNPQLFLQQHFIDPTRLPASDQQNILIISIAFLVLSWISFTVEAKRWRDMGLSGFCVLQRFVPGILIRLLPPPIGAPVALIWFVVMCLVLGCKAGDYSGETGAFGCGRAIVLLLAIVGGFFVFFFAAAFLIGLTGNKNTKLWTASGTTTRPAYPGSAPAMFAPTSASTPSASPPSSDSSPSSPSQSSTVPASPSPSSPLGTSDRHFAKSWVDVNGERLTNISSVLPAAGNRVALTCDQGGRSVPAASLPKASSTPGTSPPPP